LPSGYGRGPCPGVGERRCAIGRASDATHCRFEGARFFVRTTVGDSDELFDLAAGGRMIGSMTNAVGAPGLADGVRSRAICCRVDAGADVRRSIVQAASGAIKMNPITLKATQRSMLAMTRSALT